MLDLELRALLLILAIVLDWLIGDPQKLYRKIFHPVELMGEVLTWIEGGLNKPGVSLRAQKIRGVLALFLYLVSWIIIASALVIICDVLGVWGFGIELIIVAVFLGGRSLYNHVQEVCEALKFKTVTEARQAVGHIVGRDTAALDEHGVARAGIESGAENLSDGFIAPAMFYLFGGLIGLIVYKAVNTADSMIGYKTQRFLGFGWASARLDDVLNWIPSRLTGCMIVVMAHFLCGRGLEAWRVMKRDARKHSSPNAGWPEAAMGGALGIALAGPRVYKDMMKQDPWINARGRLDANAEDIWHALRLLKACIFFTIVLVGIFGLAVFF